jgi:hypothetical protein
MCSLFDIQPFDQTLETLTPRNLGPFLFSLSPRNLAPLKPWTLSLVFPLETLTP